MDADVHRTANPCPDGPVRLFDEDAARGMPELPTSRASYPAAAASHHRPVWLEDSTLLAPLSSITAPITIVHGDQDPVHSRAAPGQLRGSCVSKKGKSATSVRGGLAHR